MLRWLPRRELSCSDAFRQRNEYTISGMEEFKTRISRDKAAAYGREAVEIIRQGKYTAPSGRIVNIAADLERSIRATVSYPPDVTVPDSASGSRQTNIQVKNETTLSAGTRLLAAGNRPAVLNFAAATHPGGGFLNGARAQEEYLARSSGLYACLRDNPMYSFHRARYDALYTDYVIYSPQVPIFRDDEGNLLEEPYHVAVITSPAVNANHVQPGRRNEILPAMWSRILKVLSVGRLHGHDSIVLGAWGCGAFGNEPSEIAGLFHKALDQNFTGAYARVVFAIVDWSPERRFIGPFQSSFKIHSAPS
jgi:uncharacterized protein (TIGR02452 family)